MSQIKTTSLEGDVAIGRNLTAGGNAAIRGNALVKKSLKVEGWLDAPNIKGQSKGIFPDKQTLENAYPLGGNPGCWAVVLNQNGPGRIYIWNGTHWEDSGSDYNSQISSELYENQLEDLSNSLDDLYSAIDASAPPAITLEQVDKMGGNMVAKYAGLHSRYRITRTDSAKIIGVLDILYDTTLQVLTQVVTTHYDLAAHQNFTTGGFPWKLGTFYRSYQLTSSPGLEVNESGWTDWKPLNVTPSSLPTELQKPDSVTASFLPLFEAAVAPCGETLWPEVMVTRNDQPARKCGYYPDVNADAPFYVCGKWLTLRQAMLMITDRYTPYMGGVQSSAPVNLPARTKPSDSALKIDYACCNNYDHHVLVLGAQGWNASFCFQSARRAFHGCAQLRAVIGEIDLKEITSASAIVNMFANSRQLWQFHLANIPNCIETLDLSGVSDNCTEPFTFGEGDSGTSSSLKYLLQNFQRDITRTKQLTVIVPPAVFDVVSEPGDIFWSNPKITWATA